MLFFLPSWFVYQGVWLFTSSGSSIWTLGTLPSYHAVPRRCRGLWLQSEAGRGLSESRSSHMSTYGHWSPGSGGPVGTQRAWPCLPQPHSGLEPGLSLGVWPVFRARWGWGVTLISSSQPEGGGLRLGQAVPRPLRQDHHGGHGGAAEGRPSVSGSF